MTVIPDTAWTQETFFPWAEVQDLPYEFDGNRPVAMPPGNVDHSRISRNVLTALRPEVTKRPAL